MTRLDPYEVLDPISSADRALMDPPPLADSLEAVRKEAGGWLTAISALFGVFALVTVFSGPKTLEDIPPGALGTLVVAAILLSALLIIGAIWLASRAANGRRRFEKNVNANDIRRSQIAEIKSSINSLRWSRRLTASGLSLVFLTFVVGWLAPNLDPQPEARVYASTGSGVFCGLLRTDEKGSVVIVPDAGSPQPVNEVETTKAGTCKPVSGASASP